jgi:hypothetical protein
MSHPAPKPPSQQDLLRDQKRKLEKELEDLTLEEQVADLKKKVNELKGKKDGSRVINE